MSIEQAITDLTAAIREFIASATQQCTAAPAAAAAESPKRGRPRKDASAAEPTGPADALGNPAGTTYWLNTKHDSVYRIVPGDGSSPMPESTQLSIEQFPVEQARIAEKFKHVPGATPSPTQAQSQPAAQTASSAAASRPTAATNPTAAQGAAPDYAATRVALLAIANGDPTNGRARVMAILSANGVNSVPELANKSAEVLAAVHAAATATDPLLG
jgi:hypothetical protein